MRDDGIGPWVNCLTLLTWLGSISSAANISLSGTQPIFNFVFAIEHEDVDR
jgi:hypothetical protein